MLTSHLLLLPCVLSLSLVAQDVAPPATTVAAEARPSAAVGFTDAASYGFSPTACGEDNTRALQAALDQGGTVIVSRPGIYAMAGTALIGSDTTLSFGNGVVLKKVADKGKFAQVICNKGALTRTWDRNIVIDGLNLMVNGVDHTMGPVFGLRGQIGIFYAKDVRITRFRCMDLGKGQYAIQVCTFEDLIVNDVTVKGGKDGVHLGRGRRYLIANGVFQNGDDAVALNGHDYASGNPELGWIEDGVVTNCYDLEDENPPIGYFCRILAGGWLDWKPGLEVQNSDSVVSEGRVYRVQGKPDGTLYTSTTKPTHDSGTKVLDGITWGVVQADAEHTAGVRNVVFRDIFLYKQRPGFSVHFDKDKYSRSYYPGAEIPLQQGLRFDSIHALYQKPMRFLQSNTPIDVITITNSTLRNASFLFRDNVPLERELTTRLSITNSLFTNPGPVELLTNTMPKKVVVLQTSGNIALSDAFEAKVVAGPGTVTVNSDLNGLRK